MKVGRQQLTKIGQQSSLKMVKKRCRKSVDKGWAMTMPKNNGWRLTTVAVGG